MKKLAMLSTLALIVLIIICQPFATSAAAPAPKAAAEKAKGTWEAEWHRVVDAAKKEGKVMIFSTPSGDVIRNLASAFEKKYGIKVEWINGRGEELAQRMGTEKTAGIKTADVVMSGDATILIVMKPRGLLGKIDTQLILPEVLDPQAWVVKHVPYFDKDRTGIAVLATPQRYVLRNTDMVKEHEITSYKDLLNPKWKGKITMNDPAVTGTASGFMTMLSVNFWGVEGTREFMRQLVKQEPAITRDRRLQAESVARGKYAISIATNFENAIEFINLGSPLAFVKIKEGGKLGSGAGGLAVAETPAHPNAAKVFINWILSKEGHSVFVKSYGSPGSRSDAPREGIPPQMFAEPDEKFYEETEEGTLARTEIMKIAKEIFAPLLK